ncbi:MAG: hypothetical protein LBF89_04045 [Bacteroidales bacterium]|jgi:hypothetical protein|nr:hypothetical protein [Bacteroidales bacterium]
MKILFLIALAGCLLSACVARKTFAVDESLYLRMADTLGVSRYLATITTTGRQVTGVLMVKYDGTGWRGALMNEFGIKLFDFASLGDKCRMEHLLPFLDRWYIRKTLAGDFRLLFGCDTPDAKVFRQAQRRTDGDTLSITLRSREIRRFPDGKIKLQNKKNKMVYVFNKINKITNETSR